MRGKTNKLNPWWSLCNLSTCYAYEKLIHARNTCYFSWQVVGNTLYEMYSLNQKTWPSIVSPMETMRMSMVVVIMGMVRMGIVIMKHDGDGGWYMMDNEEDDDNMIMRLDKILGQWVHMYYHTEYFCEYVNIK